MIFQEHTTTDYAIKENTIAYDLNAATVCFFAKDTDDNKPSSGHGGVECVYSYNDGKAYAGNALELCTAPKLNVWFGSSERYCLPCNSLLLTKQQIIVNWRKKYLTSCSAVPLLKVFLTSKGALKLYNKARINQDYKIVYSCTQSF